MHDNPLSKPTLLVIDDIPENLTLMYQLLKDDYKVKGASNGQKGIDIAESANPDLILLDIMMPDMDGFEVCQQLKINPATAHIPIIFLTARMDELDEHKGLQLGAVDYVTKPINPDIVKARVKTHVSLKLANDLLNSEKISLKNEVDLQTQEALFQNAEMRDIQDVAFHAMISLAEKRDNETGNHIRRTQAYIKLLAGKLRLNPLYTDELDNKTIDLLYKSAPLHDIGKIGIPDAILLKTGKLTEEEFEIMKTHTTIGYEAIRNSEKITGRSMSFLRYAKEIAYSHHEHWNGDGYPLGLKGIQIPLSARLMAVADVYDALISKRVYKPPFSHQQAVKLIMDGKGTHFDPDIVDVFYNIADMFNEITKLYKD